MVAPGELCKLRFRAFDWGYSPIELLSVSLKDIGRYPIEPLEWRHGGVCVGEQAGLALDMPQSCSLRLGLPWPNPTNGKVSVPVYAGGQDLGCGSVAVFDAAGRLVAEFGVRPALAANVVWDARDGRGNPVPAGIYFLRFSLLGEVACRRVVVLP